ncbi:tRNA lysidine(34) synthetase TilS [Thalassotalea sp. SU-HH00458]
MILPTLTNFLNHYPHAPIVIAYSGGVDSQVLLHAIAQLKKNNMVNQAVMAIHVNHGLSQSAGQWQQFAKQQCQLLNIDFKTINVNVIDKPRTSLEAQARDARYQALADLSPSNAVILTGHHQDDQVETFFLSLKRGSGLKGLSAMAMVSSFANAKQKLLRPLLQISRENIVCYAQENQLTWLEDESNDDIRFDRNFLRKEILPQLKARWLNFNDTVMRSTQHCQEAQSILDEVAAQDLAQCIQAQRVLSIAPLLLLSQARFNLVIRYFIEQHQGLMPSQQQLQQLYQQLTEAGKDKNPAVKLGEIWLRRFQDKLYLTEDYQSVINWRYDYDLAQTHGEYSIELPDGLGDVTVTYDELNVHEKSFTLSLPDSLQSMSIVFAHDNPKCLPEYRQQSRPLKKVLQELSIPPWQRKRLPLLFINDELAAVIGYFVCQPFSENKHQQKIMVHWQKESG